MACFPNLLFCFPCLPYFPAVIHHLNERGSIRFVQIPLNIFVLHNDGSSYHIKERIKERYVLQQLVNEPASITHTAYYI